MTDIASLVIEINSMSAKDAASALNALEKQSGKTEQSAASMIRQFAGATAVLGTTIAVIKNSVKAATEYQSSLTGLASVARYAGADITNTLGKANEITADGMMSMSEAATAMKNLLAKGFNTQEAVEMITRLKDAAAFGKQGSLEFGQAVLSATEGIKNENSVLVDNAGVTKNISVMVEEYASNIGKTVKQLSEAEKRQAVYNGLMRETEGQLGNTALAAQGMEGASARMTKAVNDSAITIGQAFMPAAVALTNMLTEGMKGSMDVIRPFLFLFESIGVSAGELVMKMGVVWDYLSSPSRWLNPAKAQAEMNAQFKIYEDIAEQSRIDIAARLAGNAIPVVNLGTDTGKRRDDIVQKDMKAEKDAAEALADAYKEVNAILADIDPLIKSNQEWQKLLDLQKQTGKFTVEQLGKAYENAMGGAREMTKVQKEETVKMNETWSRFTENMQRNFGDVLYNGMNGKFNGIGDMFKQMLMRMAADAAAAKLTQTLFGNGSAGVGAAILGAFTGGGQNYGSGISEAAWMAQPNYAGGGFTGNGSRSGGMDGMGGFPAILHPQETVIDHASGQSGGVVINDNRVINVEASADRNEVYKNIMRMIEDGNARLVDRLQRQGQLA